MPIVVVVGAKGGCGASLVASNLALALARHDQTILVDLHLGDGVDDLLLDLRPDRSWADLLPVVSELSSQQLNLALQVHPSGVRLLAGPAVAPGDSWAQPCRLLLRGLVQRYDWIVIDSAAVASSIWLGDTDAVVLVATADPPSLRCAQRMLASFSTNDRLRVGIVINQFTRTHPAHPAVRGRLPRLPIVGGAPDGSARRRIPGQLRAPLPPGRAERVGRGVAGMARALATKLGAERAAA